MAITHYHQPSAMTVSDDSAARAALTAEALPLLAVLRKGAPKEGNKPGRELPYFRVDWRPGYEGLARVFEHLYGPQPDRIGGLRLIGEHPFQFFYETWHGNATLKARHDGRAFIKRWAGAEGYDFTPVPVDQYPTLAAECSPVGRLFFWLPALAAETFEIGKFIAITTSINDCAGLYSYVEMLRLSRLPLYDLDFEVYREGRNFTVPVNGKPSVVTKHMIRLRVMPGSYRPAQPEPDDTRLDVLAGEILDDGVDLRPDQSARCLTPDETRQLYAEAKAARVDKDTLLELLDVTSIEQWVAVEPLLMGVARVRRHVEVNTPPEQQSLLDVPGPVEYD